MQTVIIISVKLIAPDQSFQLVQHLRQSSQLLLSAAMHPSSKMVKESMTAFQLQECFSDQCLQSD